MNGPGLGGSATPRASVRELERFLAFVEKFGTDEDRRSYLREVIDATKAYQEAAQKAEVAEAAAAKRVSEAAFAFRSHASRSSAEGAEMGLG